MGPVFVFVAAVTAALALAATRWSPRLAHRILAVAVIALLAATLRAGWLLATHDTSYRLVADHTRPDLGIVGRVMGLWGGSAGSLLAFTAVIGVVAVAAPLATRWRALASAVVAALSLALITVETPFERLAVPATEGSGLSPILEHWAMVIHPPLLYLGLALALVPAGAPPAQARRFTTVAIAVLGAALALGGSWAYVELGWGGWWAWDPVENVALVPWLLLVASLHTGVEHRVGRWATALVWPTVFAGTAMTRTSLRTSVHAFADADGLGWIVWPLAGVVGAVAVWFAASPSPSTTARPPGRARLVSASILLAVAVIVALGTFRPFLDGTTAGTFYARFTYPLAVAGLFAIAVLPQRPERRVRAVWLSGAGAVSAVIAAALAGWSLWWQLLLAAAAGAAVTGTVWGTATGPRTPPAAALAHFGVALVLVGALGGTASQQVTVGLAVDEATELASHRIVNRGAALVADDPATIRATVEVDGAVAEPSLAIYPERRLRLPEVVTKRRLLDDVQVILRGADDDGSITVTINVEPLTSLVWIGAAFVVAATLLHPLGVRGRLAPNRRARPEAL